MRTFSFFCAICLTLSLSAQTENDDLKNVRSACMDYINAFYKADTTLAYRSVHPSIRKTGFYWKEDQSTYSEQLEMPFKALVSLASKWNDDGDKANDDTSKSVEVFEVSDKTAIAKVTAVWGIDYISLMKMEGKWMIVNVLWQSPPKSSIRNP